MCKLNDLTVDASIHGNVIEVEAYGGRKVYRAGEFREPAIDSVYCSDCGEEFENVNTAVDHLAKVTA